MENRTSSAIVPLIAALLTVAALAVIVWVTWPTNTDQVEPASLDDLPSTVANRGPASTKGDQVPRRGTLPSTRRSERLDLAANEVPAEILTSPTDVGLDVSRETLESWTASSTVKVGPQTWLQSIPPEREAEIAAILEAPMPEREVWLDVRRQSIDVFKVHAARCFESLQQRLPEARGRLIAIWEVEADGRNGRAHSLRLGPVVDLNEETFVDCLTQVQFPAWPTTAVFAPVVVEHPLMFP